MFRVFGPIMSRGIAKGTAMRLAFIALTTLTLQACGQVDDCSDLVGKWEGRPGMVVVRKVAAGRFSLEFPASSRSLDLQCKNGTLSGESPIRASRNAAGKLVLDGFPGGVIENFSRVD
jgi:hypothetical protein